MMITLLEKYETQRKLLKVCSKPMCDHFMVVDII